MQKKLKVFIFFNIFNFWLWNIFGINPQIAVLLLVSSFLLFYPKPTTKLSIINLCILIAICFLQIITTENKSLIVLSDDEKRIQQQRVREYPPTYFMVNGKLLPIPIAHWFEERIETITLSRIEKNFSEVIDANLYFFANHPRERLGYKEIEMFPFIFYPLFIYGIFLKIKSGEKLFWFFLIIPILLTSVIGLKNSFGPFSLLPAITALTSGGMYKFLDIFKSKKLLLICIIILILISVQSYAYGKY